MTANDADVEENMKAVRLFEYGGPDVLVYVDVPVPVVGVDEVLIRVRATSANAWDLRYRAGHLPASLPGRGAFPLPFQLGRDAAGEIVAVGADVNRWHVGDRVVQMAHPACGRCAMCLRGNDNLCLDVEVPGHQIFGGNAEYIVRHQDAVLTIPDGVGFEVAAATMWSYSTPLNCARRAPVGPGDTVLITGASGSMATACAQVAKLNGAIVIGTTTKTDRDDRLKAAGYDHIVHSTDPRMTDHVRDLTRGLGVDAVWDCVGGDDFFQLSVLCVRVGGTVLVLGAPLDAGRNLDMSIMTFIAKEMNVHGVRGARRRDNEICLELLADRKISPVIDRTFPLSQAAEAHAYLESQGPIGKVLLLP
ncbi:quinone oxidoreductase family protein [Amycolatopsis pithecellobii]|uniref:quinone oxidoreductase family protein n=1 Tax=Amycolatopsis pithecellobii TaxID=664692 RepID=UPI00140814CF|nr:alcohol dehydrogenase catalytic domain-containing protein [Amycolatopsis pithecellobii]